MISAWVWFGAVIELTELIIIDQRRPPSYAGVSNPSAPLTDGLEDK